MRTFNEALQSELPSQAHAGSVSAGRGGALSHEDFARIGVRPRESRLKVIRLAASKTARGLAHRQLAQPNPLTERQLSQIALSTYRLLDPRRRDDRQARVHVGRIHPGVLTQAGRTEFAEGDGLSRPGVPCPAPPAELQAGEPDQRDEPIFSPRIDACSHADPSQRAEIEGVELGSGPEPISAARPALRATSGRSAGGQLRQRLQRPWAVVMLMLALLAVATALWFWGQRSQAPPPRLAPWMQGETTP